MRKNGMALLQSFVEGPVLYAPEHVAHLRVLAESYAEDRGLMAKLDNLLSGFSLGGGASRHREEAIIATNDGLCAAYGLGTSDRSKPFAFASGLAVIPVWGSLLHRDNWCDQYGTGYDYISSRFSAAVADPDVKGIVLDVNSPGGHVRGNFELADMIFAARAVKPSLAMVDGMAYSGGYSIGSSATRMVSIPSGGIGSVGVVMMHVSVQELMSKWGVDINFIHAGKHKVDGNPFAALPEDVRERFQASVNKSYENFVSLVARNRGMDAEKVRATEALCYDADAALALGLIDAIQTPAEALAAFRQELDGSNTNPTQGVTKMENENEQQAGGVENVTANNTAAAPATPATAEAPSKDAATAERERVAGIIGCEEAKGREALAQHFAFKTSMSVDDARAALAASPAAAPSKPDNAFAAAMNSTENPNVGAGGAGEDAQMSVSDRLLSAHAAATGIKYDKK